MVGVSAHARYAVSVWGKLRLRANAADVVPGSPTTTQSNWPRQGLGRNRSFGQVRRKPSEFPADSVRLPSSDTSTIPRRRYAPTCMMHSFRRLALALRPAALSPGRHMCPPLSTISAFSSRMRSSLRYDLASAASSDASNAPLFLACGRSPAAFTLSSLRMRSGSDTCWRPFFATRRAYVGCAHRCRPVARQPRSALCRMRI